MRHLIILSCAAILYGCGSSAPLEVDKKLAKEPAEVWLKDPVPQQTDREMSSRPRPAPAAMARPNADAQARMVTKPIVQEYEPLGSGTAAPKAMVQKSQPRTNALLDQLKTQAKLAFSIPESANIRDKIRAQLVVDISRELSEVAKDLTVRGTVTTGTFNTTRIIRAKLTAPNFEVSTGEDAEQILIENQPAVWNWYLEPKTSGDLDVALTVEAKVEINSREKSTHIKTFEKVVTVQISKKQQVWSWVQNRWEDIANWLWSVILVPLGLWWWRRRQEKDDE